MIKKEDIQKYNPNDDYIFISYSSKEEDIVWKDAYELQKRGINVWIDPNLDEKKDNWHKADALPVIEKVNCSLLIFYISSNSLQSKNCFLELSHIEHPNTLENHLDENLPCLFIETEPIDDLKEFIERLHKKNKGNKSLKPETQNAIAKTITCYKRFFDKADRFDKIRIPCLQEDQDADTYYKNLIDIFPDEIKMQALTIDTASLQVQSSADSVNQEIVYEDGNRYIGEVKDGKPHGIGKMMYVNGYEFFGEWDNGKKQGVGKLSYPKDSPRETLYYFGEWKGDKKHGYGLSAYKSNPPCWDKWENGGHAAKTPK